MKRNGIYSRADMNHMDVLVIGGSGLVGSNVVRAADDRGADVTATYRTNETAETAVELDVTDRDVTAAVLQRTSPDVVVNTAAFHAVDACEEERDRAWTVNATGARNVARAADAVDAHLVHVSTDYVFPGHPAEAPYDEDDPVSPLNYYGRTKYAGEQAVQIADRWTVVRPSVVYGVSSGNFLTWALGELEAGNELTIVDDQVSVPTYAPDLAQACLEVFEKGLTGVFHAAGPDSMSRYEFTVGLAETFGYDPDLVSPISTEAFGQEAPRPTDSSLDSTRLYRALDREFRSPSRAFESIRSEWPAE